MNNYSSLSNASESIENEVVNKNETIKVSPVAYLPQGVRNHVTQEGFDALVHRRNVLLDQRAAFNGLAYELEILNKTISGVQKRIDTAVVVDMNEVKRKAKRSFRPTVCFGTWVRYNGCTVRIVGVDEADGSKGLVSFVSPLGKALMGRIVGETFDFRVPKGIVKITIQGIGYRPVKQKVKELKVKPLKRNEFKPKRVKLKKNNVAEVVETKQSIVTHKVAEDNDLIYIPQEGKMDFLPAVNEQGNIVGRAIHSDVHSGFTRILHPAVHVHIINNGVTVGKFWWHVAYGEQPQRTLVRRLNDDLHISEAKPRLRRQYIRETQRERELVSVFTLDFDGPVLQTPDTREYAGIFEKD